MRKPHLFRCDHKGYLYRWVARGLFKRVDKDETGEASPAMILDHEVMVRHPEEEERFVKTHKCVLYVDCPFCKVKRGELCRGVHGVTAGTHADRREELSRLIRAKGRGV